MRELIGAVGRELKTRDPQHGALKRLRELYANPVVNEHEREWLELWASVLRVPPFENSLPISGHCTACSDRTQIGTRTVMTFPGGWVSACTSCQSRRMTFERGHK